MLLYIASSKLARARRWDPISGRQGTNERAPRVKVLATKPDDLGSVPHGRRREPAPESLDLHTKAVAGARTHTR